MKQSNLILSLVATIAVGTVALREAFAQLDHGFYAIEQNGKRAGVIYVSARQAGATVYAEHWVLFANYVYPDDKNRVETVIKGEPKNSFSSETEFMGRFEIPAGGKYIRVDSSEFSKFPVKK